MPFYVTTKTPDLDEDWRAIGHVPRKRPVEREPVLPSLDAVQPWLTALGTNGHTVLTVPGASPQARTGFYRDLPAPFCEVDHHHTRTWLLRGPITDWVDRLRRMPVLTECVEVAPNTPTGPAFWRWLWTLAYVEDFVIDAPVRSMVDRPYHLIHDALRLFMGLRFLVLEGAPQEQIAARLDLLLRWVIDPEPVSQADRRVLDEVGVWRQPGTTDERLDLLILLLTLGEINGVIGKVAFVFDDLGAACRNESRTHLRELHRLMQATVRWAKFTEIPVGLILGLDPRQASLLRRTNPKLASDVLAAMTWASV